MLDKYIIIDVLIIKSMLELNLPTEMFQKFCTMYYHMIKTKRYARSCYGANYFIFSSHKRSSRGCVLDFSNDRYTDIKHKFLCNQKITELVSKYMQLSVECVATLMIKLHGILKYQYRNLKKLTTNNIFIKVDKDTLILKIGTFSVRSSIESII